MVRRTPRHSGSCDRVATARRGHKLQLGARAPAMMQVIHQLIGFSRLKTSRSQTGKNLPVGMVGVYHPSRKFHIG